MVSQLITIEATVVWSLIFKFYYLNLVRYYSAENKTLFYCSKTVGV